MSIDKKILRFLVNYFIILIVPLIISSFLNAQQRQTLAIIDFDAFGMTIFESMTLTERLRTHAVTIGKYRIIERGAMEEILEEQGFQQTGCASDECIVEVGKLLGVQYMLGGSIGKVGNTFSVAMRIINIETSEIEKTASYDMTGSVDQLLTEGLREAAEMIFEVKAETTPPPAPELASISINSMPQRAEVNLDGEERGKTPLSLKDLQPGRPYGLRVSLPNYRPVERTLTLNPGLNEALRLTLSMEEGFLSVSGSPKGGKVYIDNKKVGTIPLLKFTYPTGEYQLKVKRPGYYGQKQSLNLTLDQEISLNFELDRKPKGRAFLFSTFVPGGGQLYLGYNGRGLLFLAAAVAAGYLVQNEYSQFLDYQKQYESDLDLYNTETNPDLFASRKATINESFQLMKDTETKFLNFIGVLGAVWTVNLVEVIF